MIRTRLPESLGIWLSERGFNFTRHDKKNYLSEDEIYSAALELWNDMNSYGNLWEEFSEPSAKRAIKIFIEREGRTHKKLPLDEWYGKGC